MRGHNRLMQHVLLAATAFTFIMCTKPEEKKAEEAPPATAADAGTTASAGSNRGVASAAFGDQTVSINYGRPQLQGRDMMAQATDGTVWRMGMNEATEINTSAGLKFGETVIPAGHYSLWMKKVSGDNWELIFNRKTGVWGHAHPAEDDFASVPMVMSTLPQAVETFTIEVQSQDAATGTITAMWGTASLSAAFAVQTM